MNPPIATSARGIVQERVDRLVNCALRPVVFAPLLLALAAGISSWYATRTLPNPDEGAVLTAAAKILRGAVFYRDIDAYPFPASHYFVAFFMAVFGEHLSVARYLAAGLYCTTVLSLYAAALRLLDRRAAALFGLSLLSFKFLGWPAFSIYLYSDFAFCFACLAVALLLGHPFRGPSARLVLAGACAGLALASKQNVGIYLGAAVVALLLFPHAVCGSARRPLRRAWPEPAVFLIGMSLPMLPLLVYFSAHGLLGQMLYSGLVRPMTGYLPTSGISFLHMLKWWELGEIRGSPALVYFVQDYWHMLMQGQLPGARWYDAYWIAGEVFSRILYTSVPVAFGAAFALRMRRARRAGRDTHTSLFTLALLSLAVVLSAFPRADSFHLISVYPLVLLLLFSLCAFVRRESTNPWSRWTAWIAAGAVSVFLVVTACLAINHRSYLTYHMKLERADVYVDPSNTWVEPLVSWISEEVAVHETLFVLGHEAQFYFLTGRFHPWPFAQLYPGQAGSDEGRALARLLERERPKTIVQGVLTWPGVPEIAAYAPILSAWVESRFEPNHRFFDDHPPPSGLVPEGWVMTVLRPSDAVTKGRP